MAGEVKEVLWNDGEGITITDLNDMQRFVRAQLWEQLVGGKLHDNTEEFDPASVTGSANLACYSIGGGGAPYSDGTTRVITLRDGIILQKVSTTYNGSDPAFLAFRCPSIASPIQFTTAVGDATNPRIDLCCVRLEVEAADAADNQTRDFEDSGGAVTSQTFVKRRKVKITTQLVAGTPAASPVEPSVPANYVKVAAIFVPANHNTSHAQANITDYRVPHGIASSITYTFDNGTGVNVESGWAGAITSGGIQSGAASEVVRVFPMPPGHYNARLLQIGTLGNLSGCTVQLVRRHHDIANGSNTDTVIQDLSSTGLTNGNNQFNAVSPTFPVWANGYPNGIAGKIQPGGGGVGDPRMTTLCLKITSSAASKTLRYVRCLWAVE
jgi:hypothetical protein